MQLFSFSKTKKILWVCFSEADTQSTWMIAMTKCRQQCSTIESDATILKQHYLKWMNNYGFLLQFTKPRGQNSIGHTRRWQNKAQTQHTMCWTPLARVGLLHLIYIVHINMYKQLLSSLTWTEINAGEYRKGNRKWIIQRHWQHRAHKMKTSKTKT